MSRFKGQPNALRKLARKLTELGQGGKTAAIKVATAAAPCLTSQMDSDFDAGVTAYGGARPLGISGNRLTLVKTGDTRSDLRFESDGTTRIRVVLTRPYQKFLIGKYAILPSGAQAIPSSWFAELARVTQEVLTAHMQGDAA